MFNASSSYFVPLSALLRLPVRNRKGGQDFAQVYYTDTQITAWKLHSSSEAETKAAIKSDPYASCTTLPAGSMMSQTRKSAEDKFDSKDICQMVCSPILFSSPSGAKLVPVSNGAA